MTTTATPLDKLYHSIFITALEGGVGYWSQAENYRWWKPGTDDYDYTGFSVILHEFEMADENDVIPTHKVTRATIAKGMRALAADKITFGGREWDTPWLGKKVREALHNPDDADFDASDADMVVQAGLFGDIRYG